MIAAVRADDLIHAGVAALDTAVHDADRLVPQDRLAAVAGLTGGRGCHDGLGHDAQPRITVITRARCRDSGRTGASHNVRITRTAHSTHRQEGVPGRYRGLEQRRRLSPDVSTRAARGNPSRVSTVPIYRVLRRCLLAVLLRRRVASSSPSFPGVSLCPDAVEMCVLPRTRRRSIYDSCDVLRPSVTAPIGPQLSRGRAGSTGTCRRPPGWAMTCPSSCTAGSRSRSGRRRWRVWPRGLPGREPCWAWEDCCR